MENKKIILILIGIIVILVIIASFTFFNSNLYDSYINVGEEYVHHPTANENVRFNGTYFGKTNFGVLNTLPGDIDVIRVGTYTFAFIVGDFNELKDKEGQDFTFEGKFNIHDTGKEKAAVNGLLATGYDFYPDKIIPINKDKTTKDNMSATSSKNNKAKSWESIGSYSGSGTGSESIKIPSGKIKIELSAYPIKNYATNHLYVTGSNGESAGVDWGSTSAVETRSDSLTYTSSSEETFDIDYYETVSWEVNIYRYQ